MASSRRGGAAGQGSRPRSVAQRGAGVVVAEHAALLQQRDDLVDERHQAAGGDVRDQDVAVGGVGLDQFVDRRRDRLRRADERLRPVTSMTTSGPTGSRLRPGPPLGGQRNGPWRTADGPALGDQVVADHRMKRAAARRRRTFVPRSRRPSARNRKSNLPRSAVWANWRNESNSIWLPAARVAPHGRVVHAGKVRGQVESAWSWFFCPPARGGVRLAGRARPSSPRSVPAS